MKSIPVLPGEFCVATADQNVTKNGIEVKPGQVWQDLDKRMAGRKRKVLSVVDDKVHMDGSPKTRVSISRMHKSSTGWMLVAQ